MTRTCRHCQSAFEITQDDLAFYEKVSPVFNGKKELIPPPTLCPECRYQRRLAFRNERNLYYRKCDLAGKQMISVFAPDSPYTVYNQEAWWSDAWDPLSYGKDVDFSRSFMEQFMELQRIVPRRNLIYFQNENSDFTNVCSGNKNCYLLFSSDDCVDCYYVNYVLKCHACVDCSLGERNERCYECFHCFGCHHSHHLIDCRRCLDSRFCIDCIGCTDCLFCSGQRNQRFMIHNQRYSEDDYRAHLASLELSTHAGMKRGISLWKEVCQRMTRKATHSESSEHCLGDYIVECKDCTDTFSAIRSQDCRYFSEGVQCKDCMDCSEIGFSELCYEVIEAFPEAYGVLFSCLTASTANMVYCDHCYHSKHLFGCVGLKKNEYCILNKQYTKEDYERIVPQIIEGMRERGVYGEFFPAQHSPFGYNETNAMDHFPLTKEVALAQGFRWRDNEEKDHYLGPPYTIPDNISDVSDDITKQILLCEVTKKPYKIIPQELKFYREMGIPIPRKCPDQRHRERMALRNPRKLWNRSCDNCQKPIATSYSPERPEKVLCEECYLKTVY